MLSLFDCPLKDVKRLLPIINRQGFNIVQVSPLQRVKCEDKHEWQSNEVREANKRLVLKR